MLNVVSVHSSTETTPADLVLWFEKCRAADLGLTLAEFCEFVSETLGRLLPDPDGIVERRSIIDKLHWDDLLLARACAHGSQAAWDRFLTLYRKKLLAAALAIAREESVARELADSLYADLFGTRTRADGSRISKLDSYLGRGSLEGWLKTVLAQNYVDRFRDHKRLVPLEQENDLQLTRDPAAEPEPELALIARVTDRALERLLPDQRFLLAVYYLDGKTLAEIGKILHAHESTIKRRLDKTILTLRKDIIAALCNTGMQKSRAKELLDLDVRDLGIDLRARLAQER